MQSFNGFCINIKNFGDNQAIVEFIHSKGRTKGLIKGLFSTSKKRNIVEIGNYVKFSWYGKENSLGIVAINSTIRHFGLECSLSRLQIKLFQKTIRYLETVDSLNSELENMLYDTFDKIASNSEHAKLFSLKLYQEILKFSGHGLNIEKCVQSGDEVSFISPVTGHGVSYTIGLPYKEKLFSITPVLSSKINKLLMNIPSEEEFSQTEKILDYFFKKLVDN